MKGFLIILFTLCFSSVKGQVQSNCTVPAYLLNAWNDDVKDLALKRIFDLKTSDTASIDIPQVYQDTIWKGLAAIYNIGDSLGTDSIFKKYCIHTHNSWRTAKQEYLIYVDISVPWTQNWANYQIHTGVPALDSLTTRYGFSITTVVNIGSSYTIVLSTQQSINGKAFLDSLRSFNGIFDGDEAPGVGDGNVIIYNKDDTGQYYDFYLKWGDCPAGCTSARFWKYSVDSNCSVTLLSTAAMGFDLFPSPSNCYLSVPSIQPHVVSTVLVYPNPAEDILNIKSETNKEINYKITDVTGKVDGYGATRTGAIDVHGLSPGMYLLQIKGWGTTRFLKL